MNQPIVLILVSCLFFHVRAQEAAEPSSGFLHPFRISLSLVVGISLAMFCLTFAFLVFLKFCHANLVDNFDHTTHPQNFHRLSQSSSIFSGIDRRIIESIPSFQFSVIKGSKEGLECVVCISKFEDSDILRLLPKCKHAFHMNCIDQWLERHSTCPLCRCKFDSRDLKNVTHSNSLRLSQNPSNLTDDPNVELFVEREQDDQVQGSSSRFTIGSNLRSIDRGKKQELPIQEGEGSSGDNPKLLHKFKHKIIFSDLVIKNRWSDVSPSDLLSLKSEMLSVISSKRFSSLESNSRRFPTGLSTSKQIEKVEDLERKRMFESEFSITDKNDPSSTFPSASYNESSSSEMNHMEKRSMSEITVFPRFRQFSLKNQISLVNISGKEEKIRGLWLQLVRKTVHWFSGQGSENSRQRLII
ncbi:E3 ubiquitin-protein ligase ATL42-like [Herrania umbratica]|uniref:RING-type E3 ubiquitin transferase n=1 Tax=Herrania umbratica TaxID=108875 RepID=A0A6J0ZN64_9ROSI|nr:E3 ubiquitin-protein ligase ATL42-like [Herrania umbratica]